VAVGYVTVGVVVPVGYVTVGVVVTVGTVPVGYVTVGVVVTVYLFILLRFRIKCRVCEDSGGRRCCLIRFI